ncbi:hypothetical protein [Paenibacillus sp. NFR01]|uniref:phage tail protein n=1 Tax=Paenibacillus sp. NFR01 TaxID=1566279 RepID=UPI0008C26CC5|nr:hypothetical protein [Paenibacillus sp. NFR01]SEU26621.1 hypothetical protein SAMN03159358_4526 [Paenibacillus sp. NFR01]
MAFNQANIAGVQQVNNNWITDLSKQVTNQLSANLSASFSATLNRIKLKIVNNPVYNIVNNYNVSSAQIEGSSGSAVKSQKKLADAANRGKAPAYEKLKTPEGGAVHRQAKRNDAMNSGSDAGATKFQAPKGDALRAQTKLNDVVNNGKEPLGSKIGPPIEQAVKAQEKLNDAAKGGTAEATKQSSAWDKMTGVFDKVSGVYGKVKDTMEKVLAPAAEQQKWEDMFKAKTGENDVGSAMFEKFKQRALVTGQDVNKSMQSALTFYPHTQNTEQLDKLMDYSTRLSMLSPEEKDIGDTSSAIQSAFDGDSGDLASMLNLDEADMGGLDIVAKTGNMEAFLSTLDGIMNKAGMTSTALQTMMDSPVNQWQALLGNYNNSLASIGEGALQALSPLLDMLNQAFADGSFQPVIDGLSAGLGMLAEGFMGVVQGALYLWDVLSTTLPVVLPIILGIVAGVIAYRLAMLAASIATNMQAIAMGIVTTATAIYNAVMSANPIALVIGLVIGLIVAFLGIIAALQPVRDFMAELFRGIGEIVANFVGFVIDCWTGFTNGIIDAVNFLLDGINKVIGAVGKFIGLDSKVNLELEHVDSSKFKEGLQEGIEGTFDAAADWTKDFDMDKLKDSIGLGKGDSKDPNAILEEWNKKHPGDESKITGNPPVPNPPVQNPPIPQPTSNPFASTTNITGNNLNTVNRVNEIGDIKNSVDISSDDLKMLRELAEIQSIQNFVELTPTVQVTTGNINNAGDIDSIINKIGQKLNEEFISTAQGVYG